MSAPSIEELVKQYEGHLYMSGFALQRYHSGPDGKKLRGSKRPDWKRVYIELRGNMVYRWEAGNVHMMRPDYVAAIKIGQVQITNRELEKFVPFDAVAVEFKWTGQHKSHAELQNMLELIGIKGADKTYLNFGNGSILQQWRSGIRMSRKHRRLILTKSLAQKLPRDNSGDHIFKLNCDLEWAGGQKVETCRAKVHSDGLKIKTRRGKIVIKKLDACMLIMNGKIELLGEFRYSRLKPECIHLIRLAPTEPEKAISFIAAVLTLPKLLQYHTMIEYARDPETPKIEAKPLMQQELPLTEIQKQLLPDEDEELLSSLKSLRLVPHSQTGIEFTSEMFDAMLSLLIEPSPIDVVPVEFFYKALLNAWSVLEIDLAPSPQVVMIWMQKRSYKIITEDDRDMWVGFCLKPINYELHKRRKASLIDNNKIQIAL